MRHVTDEHDIAAFADEHFGDPARRIVSLQTSRRGNLGQRLARAPKDFGRLARAELTTVPDDVRSHAPLGGPARQLLCAGAAMG
jgi:hypothetical protein